MMIKNQEQIIGNQQKILEQHETKLNDMEKIMKNQEKIIEQNEKKLLEQENQTKNHDAIMKKHEQYLKELGEGLKQQVNLNNNIYNWVKKQCP